MTLEKQYRIALRLYPADWRTQHADDMLGTLMDSARPGQRLVALPELGSIALHGIGLRMRAGSHYWPIAGAALLLFCVSASVQLLITPVSWPFYLASLIVVLIPGTGVIYSVSVAIAQGWRLGSAAALGCTLGIVPHLVAASVGLSGLMHAGAEVFEWVRWLGVGYLVWLAVGMLRSSISVAPTASADAPAKLLSTVTRGIILNLLNPKLTLFFFAFLPQFLATRPTAFDPRLIGLSLIFMAMTLAVFLVYVALAVQIRQRVLASPSLMKLIERVLGSLMLLLAVRLATAER